MRRWTLKNYVTAIVSFSAIYSLQHCVHQNHLESLDLREEEREIGHESLPPLRRYYLGQEE